MRKEVSSLNTIISEGIWQIVEIFEPDTEKVQEFEEVFCTLVVDEVLNGVYYGINNLGDRLYGFDSAGESVTYNMKKALQLTGIDRRGELPIGNTLVSVFVTVSDSIIEEAKALQSDMQSRGKVKCLELYRCYKEKVDN